MIKMAKGDVARKAARSKHREQQIGRHDQLKELGERLDQSAEARGQNVNQARWDAAAAQIQPKTVGEKAAVRALEKPRDVEQHAPEAEAIPITEQTQKPGLLSRWVEAGKKIAAAATVAAAVSPAAVGDAAEVPVSERTHIRVTEDTTKEVRGVVKRDGKVFVSKKGKRGKAVADLRPGDTIHVYEQTTIDDEGLHIINEEDYYGDWVLGDKDKPQARLHLERDNKGKVKGYLLQPVPDKERTHIQYTIKDGEFNTDSGKVCGQWEISIYAGLKTKRPQGGAQFLLQDDRTLLYGYRQSSYKNPSGKFTLPQKVLGPWKKDPLIKPSVGTHPITPSTTGYSSGFGLTTSTLRPTLITPLTSVTPSTGLISEVDIMLGSEPDKKFFDNVDGALGKMLDGLKGDRSLESNPQFWLRVGMLLASTGQKKPGDWDGLTEPQKQDKILALGCFNRAYDLDHYLNDKVYHPAGATLAQAFAGTRDQMRVTNAEAAKMGVRVKSDGSIELVR